MGGRTKLVRFLNDHKIKITSSLCDIHRDTLECMHPIHPSPTKCIPYRMNYDHSQCDLFDNTLLIDIDHIMLLDLAVLILNHNFRQDFGNLLDPNIGNALEILLGDLPLQNGYNRNCICPMGASQTIRAGYLHH